MAFSKEQTNVKPIMALFGNPLLDISVFLPNEDILTKYNISRNSESEITVETMEAMMADINKLSLKTEYVAGGSAQNTARVMQWLLSEPGLIAFVGSIGKDEYGKQLSEMVENDGVNTRYVVQEKEPTGLCIACINGPHRALVAHLGAATKYSLKDLQQCELDILNKVDIIYIEGFFITDRYDVCDRISAFCIEQKKLFVLNISGKYLIPTHGKQLKSFAEKCDILFGNKEEFEALGPLLDLPDGVPPTAENVALYLNQAQEYKSNLIDKIVVVTDNLKPVLCVSGNQVVERFPVPKIDSKEVIDTTGAGDAFVAGFMAGFVKKKSILECLGKGCWMAGQIIRRIGCSLPEKKLNEF